MKKIFSLACIVLLSVSVVHASSIGLQSPTYQTQVFLSSGTFVVPPGVSRILATVVNGGCGGGGGHTADPGGGGGGGAAAAPIVNMPVLVTPLSSLTVTVGIPGLGGAPGAAGGNLNTGSSIAGTVIGTVSPTGCAGGGTGTATNGGAGGQTGINANGGATGTGAGANSSAVQYRNSGGDIVWTSGGGAGGGPSNNGGVGIQVGNFYTGNVAGGTASGAKGGGGGGGQSIFTTSPGTGGSNAAGTTVPSTSYGNGGGGGAATFAGGNGGPGIVIISW